LFGWLAMMFQPAAGFSLTPIQHQPVATSQPTVFSLTTNQHQPPATSQPNEAKMVDFLL
jgi:hypothetical protein